MEIFNTKPVGLDLETDSARRRPLHSRGCICLYSSTLCSSLLALAWFFAAWVGRNRQELNALASSYLCVRLAKTMTTGSPRGLGITSPY
ncbi:MAG: hypothetical protein ACRCVT_01955 [Leadbetterella sp.]